jgi:hypothetical protein
MALLDRLGLSQRRAGVIALSRPSSRLRPVDVAAVELTSSTRPAPAGIETVNTSPMPRYR